MAKISRSVRWEPESCSLADEYIQLLEDALGVKSSFSEIVNEALVTYLALKTAEYNELMHKGKFVMQTSKGRLRKIEFSEEHLDRISTLKQRAEYIENMMF